MSDTTATTIPLAEAMRAQMPVAEKWAYFDHAAVAPLSGPACNALKTWADEITTGGDTLWPTWSKKLETTRTQTAKLINASPDEVALVTSTSAGINLVAEGIDWQPGDNVVILADEYPANVYPWMHQQDRGVETRTVKTNLGRVDLDQLREACDARTRVVSVSWVGFTTGCRQPIDAIADIAHSVGAFFFLDAIQGLGVLPLDVEQTPVDFLAADGHKWLLGPEGAGVAYLRKSSMEKLRATGVGWNSVVGAHDFSTINYQLKPTAARYEGGSANMPGFLALAASMEFLGQWPTQQITGAIRDISDYAATQLETLGASIATHREPYDGHDPRTGIIAFELPGRDPVALRQKCLDSGIVLSCRAGRLRVSLHAYNTQEEIDRLVDVLR